MGTHFLLRDQQPGQTQAGETGRIRGPGSAQGRTMASGGSVLSTSMSAQDEDIENKRINDIALIYFKKYKVDISGAIKTTFPFLELLRDHEFITNEMYEKSQESFKKRFSVHEVIYDVLCELEKKFDMSLLGTLFSRTIMRNYPDLLRIYRIFNKVIPEIEFLLESDGEEIEERPNDQQSLEQGTGDTSYQRVMWLGPDACNYKDTAQPERGPLELRHDTPEINATETDTTSDNKDALKSQQSNEQRAQESKTAGAELLHHGNKTSSCSVDPVHIKEEKPCLNSGVKSEAQARTDCNQMSDSIAINRKDFTEGAGPSKASTSALKRKTESIDFIKSPTSRKILCKPGAELLHHGNKTSSCSVDPVHIKEEKPCLNSGVKSEAQARTDCNQVSDSIGAELLHHGNKTSSCSVDPVHIKEEKPCLNSGVKSEAQARTDCNQVSDSIGTVDLGNKSTLEKAEKKKRIRKHIDGTMDFDAEILPVICGEMVGLLIKRKFERGSTVKCIRSQDGNWFTLQEFELKGGVKNANWKTSVRCNGRTLKWLMEENFLPQPPRIYGKIKKLENAEKCEICWEEGKFIYCCVCLKGFHGDCHLPPVEPQRAPWRCTFCTIEFSSRSQQQYYSESEVLARQMGPNDKSKCEFLLLKAYCHFETNVFPNIPHENYVQKASQCLETLRRLDEIKNSLKGGCYAQVEGFVLDMNNIYQDPKQNDSDLIMEEFKTNFKQIFAIQEANQNSSLV